MSTSSKTPSNETAKTASAPNLQLPKGPRTLVFGTLVVLGTALIVVMALLSLGGRAPGQTTLRAGTQRYALEVAATPESQEKGLGGRKTMASNTGMLFVFADEQQRCFWMKGMQFSLDIIWLDANKEVTHIERGATPESYPEDTFCPTAPARYVVELRAGQAKHAGIREGQTLTF